jgi:phosphohistidine phosphatase SixA
MHITRTKQILACVFLSLTIVKADLSDAHANNLWEALASGNHFAIIRHGLAPGYSDPRQFDLSDCQTQRNLNKEGRLQSKKIGDLFRLNGINEPAIFSSHWCRCLETAHLMNFGQVSKLSALNSFFENFDRKDAQTQELRLWISEASLEVPTILITHQVNISALTGHSAASGEIIFVRRDPNGVLTVIGSVGTLN